MIMPDQQATGPRPFVPVFSILSCSLWAHGGNMPTAIERLVAVKPFCQEDGRHVRDFLQGNPTNRD
jgi:hypothetical protein